ARVRQRLGLDRPLVAQYAGWAGAALRGDLGRSFKTNDPVATLIVDRLGPTLQLTAGALLFAIAVAVPLGVLAAVRRGSGWDTVGSAVSLFGSRSRASGSASCSSSSSPGGGLSFRPPGRASAGATAACPP